MLVSSARGLMSPMRLMRRGVANPLLVFPTSPGKCPGERLSGKCRIKAEGIWPRSTTPMPSSSSPTTRTAGLVEDFHFDRIPEAGRKMPHAPDGTGYLIGARREQKRGEKV